MFKDPKPDLPQLKFKNISHRQPGQFCIFPQNWLKIGRADWLKIGRADWLKIGRADWLKIGRAEQKSRADINILYPK